MASRAKQDDGGEIVIIPMDVLYVRVCILGTSALCMNRKSERVCRALLSPPPRKNKAEQAMTLKHNPPEEFRASVYRTRQSEPPTRLVFPAGAFRKATASVALDVPGATKAAISRLVKTEENNVDIYGVPRLFMCDV